MYKTILVPLDESKRAEAILPHVESLALRFGAKVIFFRVQETAVLFGYDEMVDMSKYLEVRNSQRKETEAYLDSLQGEFRTKGIEARWLIGQGSVVAAIISAAERENIDLVAMASHGRGGLSRTFYGSVAAGVLQRIDRPLLLIRSRPAE